MDHMFPRQGNPPAEMLEDVRGSAKRAINYIWLFVGDLGIDGASGRYFAEIVGTHGAGSEEPAESPLSYDVISATSDDIFAETDPVQFRELVELHAERYGLRVNVLSWQAVDVPRGQRAAISRA